MAGTPRTDPRVVKDYLQPRKFLRDMRARARSNSRKRTTAPRSRSSR